MALPCLSILDVAERYAAPEVDLFLMTRAERGSAVSFGGRLRHLPAEMTTVVDTIGAGDAFMSGLIYELLRSEAATQLAAGNVEHELLDNCARTALRSAAVTVSRMGQPPPQPPRACTTVASSEPACVADISLLDGG